MGANPTTDQYLAEVAARNTGHSTCSQQPCAAQVNEAEWRKALLAELPDVDPAVIGQVMLHIGMRLANLELGLLLIGAPRRMLPMYIASTMQYVGAEIMTDSRGGDAVKAAG